MQSDPASVSFGSGNSISPPQEGISKGLCLLLQMLRLQTRVHTSLGSEAPPTPTAARELQASCLRTLPWASCLHPKPPRALSRSHQPQATLGRRPTENWPPTWLICWKSTRKKAVLLFHQIDHTQPPTHLAVFSFLLALVKGNAAARCQHLPFVLAPVHVLKSC